MATRAITQSGMRENILLFFEQENAFSKADLKVARIHELFEIQTAKTPDATAVVFEDGALTYRELNARANQVARSLHALGVGQETLVGICLTRTPRMFIGILGVLKAGAAYVPMDPAYPEERLAFILDDTHAPVLLTEEVSRSLYTSPVTNAIYLDSDWPEIARQSRDNFFSDAKSDKLAYVIYKSDLNGKPKVAVLTHQNAMAFVRWAHDVFSDEELGKVLFSTSVCSDLSIFEMFVPLSWGGKIILAGNTPALRDISVTA